MRIAIIGNLCNLGYLTLLALKKTGIESALFISGNELNTVADPRQENIYCMETENIYFWEEKINATMEEKKLIKKYSLYDLSNSNTISILKCAYYVNRNFDFVIGVTLGSIIALLSRRKFIWIATGSDLREWVFRKNKISSWALHCVARKAYKILSSADIGCEKSAKKLGVSKKLIQLMNFPVNADGIIASVKNLKKPLEKEVLLIFHPTNHIWDVKGNDKLIYAFAKVISKGKTNIRLLMLRRGKDLYKSEALVKELGIEEYVVWKDALSKEELNQQIFTSDIIADQFFLGDIGGITREACCLGSPVLAYLQNKNDNRPIINCFSVEEIQEAIEKCMCVEYRKYMGIKAQIYAEKNFSLEGYGQFLEEILMERG